MLPLQHTPLVAEPAVRRDHLPQHHGAPGRGDGPRRRGVARRWRDRGRLPRGRFRLAREDAATICTPQGSARLASRHLAREGRLCGSDQLSQAFEPLVDRSCDPRRGGPPARSRRDGRGSTAPLRGGRLRRAGAAAGGPFRSARRSGSATSAKRRRRSPPQPPISRAREPSSPALLLVRQAQHLMGKSFHEVIEALLPSMRNRPRSGSEPTRSSSCRSSVCPASLAQRQASRRLRVTASSDEAADRRATRAARTSRAYRKRRIRSAKPAVKGRTDTNLRRRRRRRSDGDDAA